MDGSLFFLDGVTFQKAGEIFFEVEATWEEQQACPNSYQSSLDIFAKTLLFGRALAIGREFPEAAPGVIPGNYLRGYIGDFACPVDNAGKGGKPDDLLSDELERHRVRSLIRQLTDIAKTPSFIYWKEHAIRESRWIGSDPTLQEKQEDPSKYTYRRRFNQDADLRSSVPHDFLSLIVDHVRCGGWVDPSVIDDALNIFFAENFVTHILTFCWYREVIPATLNDPSSVYQPHATRTALVPPHADIYRVELPAVLGPVLRRADRPIDVLDELLHSALKLRHGELSDRLRQTTEYGASGQTSKASREAERCRRLARRSGEKTSKFQLTFWPPSIKYQRVEIFQEYEHAFKPTGAPTFSPQMSDLMLEVEYQREIDRIFGPKRRSLSFLSKGYEKAVHAMDRDVWVDFLCDKFEYWKRPTRDDIERFVGQFPPELQDGVLRMLRSVVLIRDGDFDFAYRQLIRRQPQLFGEQTVICPFDTSGGSAALMQYMSAHSSQCRHVAGLNEALKLIPTPGRITLIDDAAITGTQAGHIFAEYMGDRAPEHVSPLSDEEKELLRSERVELSLLLIFSMDPMKATITEQLRALYPKVKVQVERIAQLDNRALFRDQSYIFGPMAEKAKGFFVEVGREILKERAAREAKKKGLTSLQIESYRTKNAIGFGDRQLLVVYSYNIPKPTVTLLWESGGSDWYPLFPIREPEQ